MAVLPPLKQEIHQLHSRLCAGLADPKRILLLYALADGPHNVSDLTETLALPQPTISRHLKLLRERGLVIAERDGQSVFYHLLLALFQGLLLAMGMVLCIGQIDRTRCT